MLGGKSTIVGIVCHDYDRTSIIKHPSRGKIIIVDI
jgi:hypothetical protein